MERMDRIEKSAFRKGHYVGYGSNGVTYRLHKDSSSGYWLAIAEPWVKESTGRASTAKPNSFYAKTQCRPRARSKRTESRCQKHSHRQESWEVVDHGRRVQVGEDHGPR